MIDLIILGVFVITIVLNQFIHSLCILFPGHIFPGYTQCFSCPVAPA